MSLQSDGMFQHMLIVTNYPQRVVPFSNPISCDPAMLKAFPSMLCGHLGCAAGPASLLKHQHYCWGPAPSTFISVTEVELDPSSLPHYQSGNKALCLCYVICICKLYYPPQGYPGAEQVCAYVFLWWVG